MRSDYIALALLWAAYCAVHSLLISIRATHFFQRVLGAKHCYFRILFNLFSIGTLLPLLLFSDSPQFKSSVLFAWEGNWRIARYSLAALAVVLIIGGARHYSISQFIGFQQIRNNRISSAMTQSGDLDSGGILRFTRHPWYVAVFILIWVADLTVGTVIINAVLSAYLVIGTLLEERKLVLEFGDKYLEYQRKVSMFIPLKRPIWIQNCENRLPVDSDRSAQIYRHARRPEADHQV
jgi:methanethiol S-methyltransferase